MTMTKNSLVDNLTASETRSSLFEKTISSEPTVVCSAFNQGGKAGLVSFSNIGSTLSADTPDAVAAAFPKTTAEHKGEILQAGTESKTVAGKRVAVLFSGGPAAGGHNVLSGIHAILGAQNTLLGVKAGPKGLIQGDLFEIDSAELAKVHNLGGFDFLGSDRTKIKTDEQFAAVAETVKKFKLDGIIVVGGDDSNTNAAILAEYLYDSGCKVIGVPKTIDGDLQVGSLLPISFGFDTATKVYSELVGNILQDTPSSRKYWHFIKLMGRSASQVALEVALQTKPAVTLISEEVAAKKMSLDEIVTQIADVVAYRASKKLNYGAVLIPEGLIEFVPEFNVLISELNELMSHYEAELAAKNFAEQIEFLNSKLTSVSGKLLLSLPEEIQKMLLLERDSHGNLQVSQIPTERLLMEMVGRKIKQSGSKLKFSAIGHFFGYEGRCGAPTAFDAVFTYNLGITAGALVLNGKTGYMAAITELETGGKALAVPLTGLIHSERRHGKDELVIEKALVQLDSPAFKYFTDRRKAWSQDDLFCSPGPRQYWGPCANQLPILVALNQGYESIQYNIT